jgi:hypothetical protein
MFQIGPVTPEAQSIELQPAVVRSEATGIIPIVGSAAIREQDDVSEASGTLGLSISFGGSLVTRGPRPSLLTTSWSERAFGLTSTAQTTPTSCIK